MKIFVAVQRPDIIRFSISMSSTVTNPEATLQSFNRQFQLTALEQEAVEWAWPQEIGDKMFNIVNTYTRAAQFTGLSASSSYTLQKVGGNILAMVAK